MNIKGQGHSLTLVQGHWDSTFLNFFSRENAKPIEAKFNMEPQWDRGTKSCSNGPGHMTKMATMPIYEKKTWKIFLLWNQKADDLESLYAASSAQVLPSLFKWWHWVDLDLFYDKVKFGPLGFCMGKSWNNGFFRNYCCLWYKSWYMQSTKWVHEAL